MADEQEMITRLVSISVNGIIRKLTSETLTFDRIDNLQYRVDWLYHTTVRYRDTGIIDARIVRCLREAREFLYGSRSGGPKRAKNNKYLLVQEEDRCLIYPKNSWNVLQKKGSLLKKCLNCLVSANVRLKGAVQAS